MNEIDSKEHDWCVTYIDLKGSIKKDYVTCACVHTARILIKDTGKVKELLSVILA